MRSFLIAFSFITLFLFRCEPAQETIVIENETYQREFLVKTNGPGVIRIKTIFQDQEISGEGNPWFEFVIDNQVVSSEDAYWQFKSIKEKALGHGGVEHELIFEGLAEPVQGLQLVFLQQLFPGNTWLREKLILKSGERTFHLNKLNDRLHFRYPQYALAAGPTSLNATEIRIASWERKPTSFNKPGTGEPTGNHMYYPDLITTNLQIGDSKSVKGPLNILETGKTTWISLYEHASQDDLNGILQKDKVSSDGKIIDAMQGTKGVFNFAVQDQDFTFIALNQELKQGQALVGAELVRGGYLDGEVIDPSHPYETVWYASAFYQHGGVEEGKMMIRDYLFNWICDQPASRKPEFYYNTWGMQRADRNQQLRGILTYERIFEEIERAAALGVDIFVLDDGWNQTQGIWQPHDERLPRGLSPIKAELDKYGITLGAWLSPMGIDSATERYRAHPDWVIKDSEGNPIQAQWGHPAFDFVSGFYDLFVEDCKKLVDEGVRFFKWDAINTFYSSLPNLEHGSDSYPEAEIRARYEYLLPIYVVKAMEELTAYEPELVIEVDLTEARRVMTGLAPLSQGKLFWMNNGASWYNDYSTFRTKSMRTIPNEFAGLIPLELFTYATYPHDIAGNWEYNVNTSLIAGHGFWGDLSLMDQNDLDRVGRRVAQSKMVLPYITEVNTRVTGEVGDSPEIYNQVNQEKSAGQVIAFSNDPGVFEHQVKINPGRLLAVLNHPYELEGDNLNFSFDFKEPESTRAAFIIPQESDQNEFSVVSSTGLDQVKKEVDGYTLYVQSPGKQVINVSKTQGIPKLEGSGISDLEVEESGDYYLISFKTTTVSQEVRVRRIES